MTAQPEYSSISVSPSSSTYQVQNQSAFSQQSAPFAPPMQVPTSGADFASAHTQMQPPPLPNAPFHPSAGDQPYAPPQAQSALQYREEAANRPYALSHYPTA